MLMRSEDERSVCICRAIIAVTIVVTMVIAGCFCLAMKDLSFAAKKDRIVITNADNNLVIEEGQKYALRTKAYGAVKNKKIRYQSSDSEVAEVSSGGVVLGKKRGTAYITAYVIQKGKKGKNNKNSKNKRNTKAYKSKVKIRIGPRISSLQIEGETILKAGRGETLGLTIEPEDAVNTRIRWSSSNPSVATVSSSGRVKGKSTGKVKITAKALDGSGKKRTFSISVYAFHRSDTLWVAHRGLHTTATENTAAAFRAAGKAGFWGCECDIWETKHVRNEDGNEIDEMAGQDGSETQADPEETFAIVINHDQTFDRIYGVDRQVTDMTEDEIRNDPVLGKSVCFLDQYLDICDRYKMVPVIELKDPEMTDAAIRMTAEKVYQRGEKFLQQTDWISFHSNTLKRMKAYIADSYGIDPVCTYLVSRVSEDEALAEIDIAIENGFDAVSCNHRWIFPGFIDKCQKNGLLLDQWVFKDTSADNNILYRTINDKTYQCAHLTVDFLPYKKPKK